jgi:hypothetical protein
MGAINIPSRINDVDTNIHPARFRVSWNGGEGFWKAFDKTTKTKTTIPIEKFIFLPLLRTQGASGYYEPKQMGYYSNEVLDTRLEEIEVKDNEGNIFAKGLWKDIKELCETRKVHFIANLYAAIKVDGVLELAVIELSGTSLVAFGELSTALSKSTGKATAIYNNAITVSHVIEKKKGSVNYVVPNFIVKKEGVSAETNAQADVLAKQATEYLEQYFSTNTVSATPLQAPEAPKEEPKQESKPEVQQQAPQNIPSRQQQEVQQESHQVNFEGSNGIEEELCPF